MGFLVTLQWYTVLKLILMEGKVARSVDTTRPYILVFHTYKDQIRFDPLKLEIIADHEKIFPDLKKFFKFKFLWQNQNYYNQFCAISCNSTQKWSILLFFDFSTTKNVLCWTSKTLIIWRIWIMFFYHWLIIERYICSNNINHILHYALCL